MAVEALEEKVLPFVIDSDMFVPTGKVFGQGSWGHVSEYTDVAGEQKWGIKKFCPDERAQEKQEYRNLGEDAIMLAETIPLSAAAYHVAPRIVGRDRSGKPYVAMPAYYGGTLKSKRWSYGVEKKQEKILDLATAVGYSHSFRKKAHGDIKPDNTLIDDDGEVFLTDWGSSTCTSMTSMSDDPRDNVGAWNYRAPESFKDNSHPTARSDVFSLGAVSFEMLTGEMIYDGINPANMTTKELQKHIGRKVKSLPRKFRKAISRSLSVDPYLRPDNGNKFREEFERGVKRHEDGNSLVGAVKMALKVGIPALFLGSCIYSTSIHEPQELTLSSIRPRLAEMLYEDENRETTSNIIFDKESTENLPGAYLRGFGFESIPSLAKSVTDNRIVAYLTATHVQAGMGLGTMKASVFTDVQQRNYSAYRHNGNLSRASAANVTYGIISKSIEASLGLASTEGNHVDLEDAMAIARNGIVVVNQAKRASKSQDWKEYQNAKDSNGKHIIDKKERRFVNQWLAQYHLGTS